MTHKGLVSKIYKDFLQINKKKVNNLREKNGQETWTGIAQMRRHRRPIHMCKDAQLAIRKIQITVIMKYHLPPTALTKIKSVNTALWRRFRTMEPLLYRWSERKMLQLLYRQLSIFSQVEERYPWIPLLVEQVHFSVYSFNQESSCACAQWVVCPSVCGSTDCIRVPWEMIWEAQ